MFLIDTLMLAYPFTYTIHDGHTEVTVDLQGDTYFFYIKRSDNIKKMWSIDRHANISNRNVNNNIRDIDCLEAETEFLRLEAENV